MKTFFPMIFALLWTLAGCKGVEQAQFSKVRRVQVAISAIADQTLEQDSAGATVNFEVTQDPSLELTLSTYASDADLFPEGALSISGTGSLRTLSLQPRSGTFGTSSVVVTATDGVTSDLRIFQVTVNPVVSSGNRTPRITAAPAQTFWQDQISSEVSFTISDSETAANALQVTVSSSSPALFPPASAFTWSGTGSRRILTLTPASGMSGYALVTVSVSDDHSPAATSSTSFWVTVRPNTAPTLTHSLAGLQLLQNQMSQAYTLTVADAEFPASELALTAASTRTDVLPVAAIVFGGTGTERTMTFDLAGSVAGTSTLQLTLTDPAGKSSVTSILIVVEAGAPTSTNLRPTLVESSASFTGPYVNEPFSISYSWLRDQFVASDPEGQPLSLLVSSLSGGSVVIGGRQVPAAILRPGETLQWTPAAAGTYPAFQVHAWDGTSTSTGFFQASFTVQDGVTPSVSLYLPDLSADERVGEHYGLLSWSIDDPNSRGNSTVIEYRNGSGSWTTWETPSNSRKRGRRHFKIHELMYTATPVNESLEFRISVQTSGGGVVASSGPVSVTMEHSAPTCGAIRPTGTAVASGGLHLVLHENITCATFSFRAQASLGSFETRGPYGGFVAHPSATGVETLIFQLDDRYVAYPLLVADYFNLSFDGLPYPGGFLELSGSLAAPISASCGMVVGDSSAKYLLVDDSCAGQVDLTVGTGSGQNFYQVPLSSQGNSSISVTWTQDGVPTNLVAGSAFTPVLNHSPSTGYYTGDFTGWGSGACQAVRNPSGGISSGDSFAPSSWNESCSSASLSANGAHGYYLLFRANAGDETGWFQVNPPQ